MDVLLFLISILLLKNLAQSKVIHIQVDDSKKPENGPRQAEWLKQHVTVFQTELELARANYSLQQQLPDRRVDAEVQEAQARQAKAHKEYQRANQPLEEAPKTRINVGYVGRGYDIFFGNPLPDEGVVDRGFRLPILDLKYATGRVSADGRYLVPDLVDIVSEPSATFSSSLHEVSSIHDYQHMLNSHASVSASGGGWGFSAHFSASTSYSNQQKEFSKSQSMHVDLVGRATVYHARLAASTHTFKVSDFFQAAVAALPDQACVSGVSLQPYEQVIRDFGTHFTTGVTMGASSVQRLYMKMSDVKKFSKKGVSASVAAGASGGFFGFSFSVSASAGFSMSDTTKNEIKQMHKEVTEYYIGGTPPRGNVSRTGNTDQLKEWAKTAAENPAPVMYNLLPVEELLKSDSVFTQPIPGLIKKRECLRKAIVSYCTKHSKDPKSCYDNSGRERRVKRSLDGKVNVTSNAIKYGDYVFLNNTSENGTKTDLVFQDDRQWASDEPVCYGLGTASKISENQNLFQLLPPRGKEELLGTPLRYGQAFRLNGRRGQHIILGTQKYPNVSDISLATLEYFFSNINLDTHKYDGKRVLCAPDPFTDVFVFKLEKLEDHCDFGNTTVQLILEGETGTLTGEVKMLNRYIKTVYQPFVGTTIGDLSRVTLKLMPGSTYPRGCKLLLNIIDVKSKKIYRQWKKAATTIPEKYSPSQDITLDLKSQDFFDIGSISASMDDSHYVEMEFHSADHDKGVGTIVEDDDQGVLHVKTERPRNARYWGIFPPDLLQVQNKGDVTVTEQIFDTNPHHSDQDCEKRLDYPWTIATMRDISSGSVKNGSFSDWEFDKQDTHRSVQFTFQSLSRVTQLILSPELRDKCQVKFKDRNSRQWETVKFTTNNMKKIGGSSDASVRDRYKVMIERIVTDTIKFSFDPSVEHFGIFELGVLGCLLGSQGVDIKNKNIPKDFLWAINLQDVEVTTDPVFAVAKKSSVPQGIPNVDDDTQREPVKVEIEMAGDTTTCVIDDRTLGPIIQTILGNPVAMFMDFNGKLSKKDGSLYLTLDFTVVSYSESQRELLKAEIHRRVSKSGHLMPCSKPSTGYSRGSQSGISGGLRPIDYFLIIVATVALLVVLVVGLFYLQRRVLRKSGYANLESSTSHTKENDGRGSHELTMENVITIVDHVMEKMEDRFRKEDDTMEQMPNGDASPGSSDTEMRMNKPGRGERGERKLRASTRRVKQVVPQNLGALGPDTQTSV